MLNDSMLIVQVPLSSFWGKDDEVVARDRLACAIERDLQRHGIGRFDGRDTGCNTTNLYFVEIPAEAWDQAIKTVITALKRRKLAEKTIVVRCDFVPKGYDREAVHTIVWPLDFKGKLQM